MFSKVRLKVEKRDICPVVCFVSHYPPVCNLFQGKGRPDNWENQITVPLYMKWKRRWKGGLRINETVTLMDIMPTILELTNQNSSNKTIDGKSLLPLITNLTDPLHKFVFHYLDVTQPSAVTYKKYKVFYYTITGMFLIATFKHSFMEKYEDPTHDVHSGLVRHMQKRGVRRNGCWNG